MLSTWARLTAGWTSEDLSWAEAPDGTEPEAYYDELLWETAGDRPAFARVYAGEWEPGTWLTRFDTRALATAHTADAIFEPDDGTDRLHLVIEVWGEAPADGAWLLLPLLGLGCFARRRRSA